MTTYWPQGPRPPVIGARVYNSATITVNSGAVKTLTFDSERWDTDNLHSTSANTERLTAPQSGYYLVSYTGGFSANNAGWRGLVIMHSADGQIGEIRTTPPTGADHGITVSTVYYFTAGQYAYIWAYQNSGADLTIQVTPNKSSEFMMIKVG